MPTGSPRCPVCHGNGTLTEDVEQYEFTTRDPITSKCLVCNGNGVLNPSTRLPNGQRAFEVWRKGKPVEDTPRRLNVSKKAVINPEDRAISADAVCAPSDPIPDIGLDRSVPPDLLAPSNPLGLQDLLPGLGVQAANHQEDHLYQGDQVSPSRLDRVLASGKAYLVVTETEPYYLLVYDMIRAQELSQNTWSPQDEDLYILAYKSALKDLQNKLQGVTHG